MKAPVPSPFRAPPGCDACPKGETAATEEESAALAVTAPGTEAPLHGVDKGGIVRRVQWCVSCAVCVLLLCVLCCPLALRRDRDAVMR